MKAGSSSWPTRLPARRLAAPRWPTSSKRAAPETTCNKKPPGGAQFRARPAVTFIFGLNIMGLPCRKKLQRGRRFSVVYDDFYRHLALDDATERAAVRRPVAGSEF